MAKYRGKYKKCRECKHSEEVLMMLVEVKESCPILKVRIGEEVIKTVLYAKILFFVKESRWRKCSGQAKPDNMITVNTYNTHNTEREVIGCLSFYYVKKFLNKEGI